MNYTIRLLPSGRVAVPYPEVYWMERFQDWTTLLFQMAIIRGGSKTILVNTGFLAEIAPIARAWKDYLGERCILERPEDWKPIPSLQRIGIDPGDVDYILLTPLQLYTTGNLRLFPNAKVAVSRKGWMEDIIAPTYPHHVPRQGCIGDEDLNWLQDENQKNFLLLDDVQELLPDLTCRWIGVHHRSSMLIEVKTERGLVMLSDCAFHFANVEESRPLGIAESILEAHVAYADIRQRAQHFIPLYEPLVQERYANGIVA